MEETKLKPQPASRKKVKFNFNLIIAVLLLLISFAMAGLFSWAVAGFRTDPLHSDTFWFSLIISTIINLFALMSSVSYELPTRLEKDERIITREEALLTFNITTDSTKLEQFVIDINIERKKAIYIQGVKKERQKYIRKYKPTLEDRKIWHKGTEEQKLNNEYCVRLAEYDYLASAEYIQENLPYFNIRYPEVTSSMIVREGMARSGGLGYIHTSEQKARWWAFHTIPRYIANMSLAIAWAIFFIEMVDEMDAHFWLDFLVRLVGMLLNIGTGFYLVRAYIKGIVLGDLDFRLSLARQFVVWDRQQAAAKPVAPLPEAKQSVITAETHN
jgi:hypothetical protein